MNKDTVLTNSFRDRCEREVGDAAEEVRRPPRGVLVARRSGKLLGSDGVQLVTPAQRDAPEVRLLRQGDKVRALGLIYKVRKVTNKDIVMRLVRS
jgi:hypothetical protein